MPDGNNPYLRENFQRNCITRGLTKAEETDLVLVSDLDEIPDLKKLNNFKKEMRYAVFKQLHFYYKLNLLSDCEEKKSEISFCASVKTFTTKWSAFKKVSKD